jgi:S1-C subfamily serine protease
MLSLGTLTHGGDVWFPKTFQPYRPEDPVASTEPLENDELFDNDAEMTRISPDLGSQGPEVSGEKILQVREISPASAAPPAGPWAPPPVPVPERKRSAVWRAGLVGGLVGALVAGGVAYGTVRLTERPTRTVVQAAPLGTAGSGAGAHDVDVHAVLAKVAPSVVSIEVQTRAGAAAGTGFLISDDGFIVTNAHVIEGSTGLEVKLGDGSTRPATLVGAFPANDVALIRVKDTTGLVPAVLGSSAALEVGDPVVAIGNALNLGDAPTVTTGIVSAKNRSLDAGTETSLKNLLQTDAAINHGNSGGPLVNAAGEVVGINSAGIPGAQNLGFAIEIDAVKPLIEQLRNGGGTVIAVAFLGVGSQPVGALNAEDKRDLGITATDGAAIVSVQAGSGAAATGIKVGDVIVTIDGKPIAGPEDIGAAVKVHKPGDAVTVAIQRGDAAKTLEAVLGSRAVTG